jgi:hypothetical protein
MSLRLEKECAGGSTLPISAENRRALRLERYTLIEPELLQVEIMVPFLVDLMQA